jgi:Fe-S-cluster-containing hydrogenase component 2
MRYYISTELCDNCGKCLRACPSGAIVPAHMPPSSLNWWIVNSNNPYIVQELCVACERRTGPACIEECDRLAIKVNMLV